MNHKRFAIHEHPVWADRADSLLHLDLFHWGMEGAWEQIWARRIADRQFEVCCIPFFSYGVRLGDIVETIPELAYQFVVQRVVQSNGRGNFRLVVAAEEERAQLSPLIEATLTRLHCPTERHEPGYFAVDLPAPEIRDAIETELHGYLTAERILLENV